MKSAVPARMGQMTTRNTKRGEVRAGRLSDKERVQKDTHWMISLKSSDQERFILELKKLEKLRQAGRLGTTRLQTLSSVLAHLETKFESGRLGRKLRGVLNEILNDRLQRAPRQ
jgi:hypothetical protein